MDNKTKILCVAIAVLLASNGYLLYKLGNAEDKTQPVADSNEEDKAKDKPVFVTAQEHHKEDRYYSYTVRLSDVESFQWNKETPLRDIGKPFDVEMMVGGDKPHWTLFMRKGVVKLTQLETSPDYLYVRDKTEIEKIDKYLGKKKKDK